MDGPPLPQALPVRPPDVADPLLYGLVWRAGGLATIRHEAGGDHVLNPDLAPSENAPPARRAAVLLCLVSDPEGRTAIVLTERASHLAAHAGQVALPGGKIEPGESAIEAALREAEEEVAMPRSSVLALGEVEPYLTRTGFLVSTVVGVLRTATTLHPNPDEVASAFTAPWSTVMNHQNHRKVTVTHDGRERMYYEVMVGDRRVWGVTAGILRLVHGALFTR